MNDQPRKKRGGDNREPRRAVAEAAEPPQGERIAKRLARVGIASRRDAEALVAAGRVKVNGKVLSSPAFNVGDDDLIELDGTPLPPIERTRLFLFHKPAGVVTTSRDPEGRRTVFDVLPAGLPRLVTVGRLDINTEGLLLLTNDGGLARILAMPATGWLRRYRVRVHGKVDEARLAELKGGIAVGGVFYGAIDAVLDRQQGSNAWLTLGLREGKNREVKNVLGALGLEVTRLIRVSFGPFQLGELPEGEVIELKGRHLRDQLGERLIAEAGANFDAPIVTPFSAKSSEPDRAPPKPKAPRPLQVGEGGLVKRRFGKSDERERALDRLSTRREAGAPREFRKAGKGGKPEAAIPETRRDQKPFERKGPRVTNVWMAPGARPVGKERPQPASVDEPGRKPKKARAGATDANRRFERKDRPDREEAGGERHKAPRPGRRERAQAGPVEKAEAPRRSFGSEKRPPRAAKSFGGAKAGGYGQSRAKAPGGDRPERPKKAGGPPKAASAKGRSAKPSDGRKPRGPRKDGDADRRR